MDRFAVSADGDIVRGAIDIWRIKHNRAHRAGIDVQPFRCPIYPYDLIEKADHKQRTCPLWIFALAAVW